MVTVYGFNKPYSGNSVIRIYSEMEKGDRSGCATGANFHSCAILFVFHEFFAFFVQFLTFCSFLHDFEHFLLIFCVVIFQTRSFAGAIL